MYIYKYIKLAFLLSSFFLGIEGGEGLGGDFTPLWKQTGAQGEGQSAWEESRQTGVSAFALRNTIPWPSEGMTKGPAIDFGVGSEAIQSPPFAGGAIWKLYPFI